MFSVLVGLTILGGLINAYEEGKKSRPVSDWSASDVAVWITKLDRSFSSYAEAFEKGAINGRALIPLWTTSMCPSSPVFVSVNLIRLSSIVNRTLESMGVSSAAHRLRILSEMKAVSASRS